MDSTYCSIRQGQFGTSYTFAKSACIKRMCPDCGTDKLWEILERENADLLKLNKGFNWHQWKSVEGKSAPTKLEVRGYVEVRFE